MNKLTKIFLMLIMATALVAVSCGLAACSCGSAEETTAEESGITLPEDTFDDLSEEDRLKAVKEDIDKIDELQKSGVDTDEKQAEYDAAVEDLLEKAPEYKEIVDEGRENHNINVEDMNEKFEEESSAYESSKAESLSEAASSASEAVSAASESLSEASSIANNIETGTDENGNYTLPVGTDENGEAEVIELPTIKIK